MDELLKVIISGSTVLLDTHPSKHAIELMDSYQFAKIITHCLINDIGYNMLCALFDLRIGQGKDIRAIKSYAKIMCDVMNYDLSETEKYGSWPLTKYLLNNFDEVDPGEILVQCVGTSRNISVQELTSRFESLGINVRRHTSRVNDVIHTDIMRGVNARSGLIEVETPFADKPDWIVSTYSPEEVERLRNFKGKLSGLNLFKDKDFDDSDLLDQAMYHSNNESWEDNPDMIYTDGYDPVDNALDERSNIREKHNYAREELNRLFGPVRPTPGRECDYGLGDGHRMLRCRCYEQDQNDWFTGKCYTCGDRIKKRCYALRYPLECSGYKGCYCCEYCLRLEPQEDASYIAERNIKDLMYDLNTFGIYDQ